MLLATVPTSPLRSRRPPGGRRGETGFFASRIDQKRLYQRFCGAPSRTRTDTWRILRLFFSREANSGLPDYRINPLVKCAQRAERNTTSATNCGRSADGQSSWRCAALAAVRIALSGILV